MRAGLKMQVHCKTEKIIVYIFAINRFKFIPHLQITNNICTFKPF